MDIRTIRYFLEVAQELNITRAAENLHMAQPPLSRQMQLLEEELDVKLFDRSRKHLQLTDEGLILKHRAEQIMTMLEKTESEIRELKHGISGELYIGSVEGQGPYLLASWIAGFHKKYPKVTFNLWNGSSDDATGRMQKGLSDLALIVEPYDHELFEGIPVGEEPWSAMIPGNHPLAGYPDEEVDLRELVGHPLIIPSRKSRTREIKGWFDKIDEEPTILCELSHYLNAYELVKQGVGIAIFPASTGANIKSSDVIMKRIVNPEYIAKYVLVWDRQRKLNTTAEKFVEYVRDEWSS